jgi:hypothetical protein
MFLKDLCIHETIRTFWKEITKCSRMGVLFFTVFLYSTISMGEKMRNRAHTLNYKNILERNYKMYSENLFCILKDITFKTLKLV